MRLATLNVWGLPWPISREGSARMDAIGARLPALELDWMAFQEVWTEGARLRLIDAGRRAGLIHAWHRDVALGGSGLLVLAREPFQTPHFEAFIARGFPQRVWHADYHGGKGFCALRFDTPHGARHAARYPPARAVRRRRLQRRVSAPRRAGRADLGRGRGDPDPGGGGGRFQHGTKGAASTRSSRGSPGCATARRSWTDASPPRSARTPTGGSACRTTTSASTTSSRATARACASACAGSNGSSTRPPPEPQPPTRITPACSPRSSWRRDAASHPAEPDEAAAQLAAREIAAGRAAALTRRGDQRLLAAGALGGAALAFASRRRAPISRRRLLRAGLAAGALVAVPFGLSNAALAEIAIPDEVRAYQEVEEQLAALQARGSPRPR